MKLLVLEENNCKADATQHLFDGERPLSQYWLVSKVGDFMLTKWKLNGQVKAKIDRLPQIYVDRSFLKSNKPVSKNS